MGASAKDMTTEIPKRNIDRIRKAAAFIVENCRIYRSKNGKISCLAACHQFNGSIVHLLSILPPDIRVMQWTPLNCRWAHKNTVTVSWMTEFFLLSNNSKEKKLTEINYSRRFYIDFPKMNRALVVKYTWIFTLKKIDVK